METVSEVGPWASEKLDALGKYLHAYTTIMKDQREWCRGYVYVDAFAGPGEHLVRQYPSSEDEHQPPLVGEPDLPFENAQFEFIKGSPRVALSLKYPFTNYVFVESDPTRIKLLEILKSEYTDLDIRIRQSDCNQYLRERLLSQNSGFWSQWRALVFLDPFGMQVPWTTLEGLARTNGVEVFVNFPVGMAIQRLLKRNGKFSEKERKKLNTYFGSEAWQDLLYKTEQTLFGEELRKIERSGVALVKWYRRRLKTCFNYVSSARLVRNTRKGHLYYLIHAGQNETGSKIANDILSVGEVIR